MSVSREQNIPLSFLKLKRLSSCVQERVKDFMARSLMFIVSYGAQWEELEVT